MNQKATGEAVHRLAEWRNARCFPASVREGATALTDEALALLFPHFALATPCDEPSVEEEAACLARRLRGLTASLTPFFDVPAPGTEERFLQILPDLHRTLQADAEATYHGDPAAQSVDEVILAYPGFLAVAIHRLAHALHGLGYPLLPRLMSEVAHRRTGVDIHPAARIGRSFFVDHATGVVIGETAEIGHGVKLYQGVTLGALAVQKSLAHTKRHPTIGDHCVVYANATILGGDTVVGHDTIVAGNAFVTESVPPFSFVGRNSEVRPRRSGEGADLEFHI